MLKDKVRQCKRIPLPDCFERDRKLLSVDRFALPNHPKLRQRLREISHDSPVARNLWSSKPLEFILAVYFRQGIRANIDGLIQNCHTSKRYQKAWHTQLRILRHLPVPKRKWDNIWMDFVKWLSCSKACNSILVVADRPTKMRHLVAYSKETD